jgi:hypothetical protein
MLQVVCPSATLEPQVSSSGPSAAARHHGEAGSAAERLRPPGLMMSVVELSVLGDRRKPLRASGESMAVAG